MEQFAIIGTYTRRKSEGIYQITLDTNTGQVGDLYLLAHVGSPTYLAKDEVHQIIYSVINEHDHGGVVALAEENGLWVRKSEVLSPGAAPCYVAFDEERMLVYTANYHKGTIDVYQTTPDGQLTHLQTIQHAGHSVHKNQQAPHAHYADLTPDQKYVVTCDLGTDQVITYEITSENKLNQVAIYNAPAGTGPRHIAFHPQNNTAYLFGELSSEIITLSYDKTTGAFTQEQVISTIPEHFTEFNGGAALRITTDGKFLYASNRGHDSIAIFQIQENKQLEFIEHIKTGGKTPRDFNLDESERWIVVAHQDSDHLTVFERNINNGKLKEVPQDFYVPEGVCVYF